MSPLGIGILGAAKIADKYTAAAINATPEVALIGIAARDLARAEKLAAKYDTAAYGDYDELIESPDVDALYIPLPIGLHKVWAAKALAAGKHVLCEKSLAGSYADARKLIESARSRGLALVENFMCEHHVQNLFVRDRLSAGEIGDVQSASLSFGFPPFAEDDLKYNAELEGGALNDAGAYCLDMVQFYLGKRPVALWAKSSNGDKSVDINGSVMVEFADGSSASLTYGFNYDYRNEARFWGATGQIWIDRSFSIPPERLPSVTLTRNTKATQYALSACNHFEAQLTDFARLAGGADKTAVLDKIETQAILMEAVRCSVREERLVRLSEFEHWDELV